MQITDVPLEMLREAPWNPNQADARMLERLGASLGRFGVVQPLLVRPLEAEGAFEVLSGNMRLRVLREQHAETAPCIEVAASDAQARLLSEALNRIHGDPGADLNRRADLVKRILADLPEADVLAILPDTLETLRGLATLGQAGGGDLAEQLSSMAAEEQARQATRLHVTSFSLSDPQKDAVERAVALALPRVGEAEAPNKRGLALAAICEEWTAGRGYKATARRRRRRAV